MIFASYWGSPLVQFSKFKNLLWVCWFLCKHLSNFLCPVWKLHNPYCHSHHCSNLIFLNIFYDFISIFIIYILWFVDFIGSLGKTMTCPRCRPGSKSENLGILRRQTSLSEQPNLTPTAMSFLFLPKYGSKSMLKLKKFNVN